MRKREKVLAADGRRFPGKTYVDCLLKPVFHDQRNFLFRAMFQVHRAHVVMLCDQGLLSEAEAGEILQGVEKLAGSDPSEFQYDPRYEDLFFMVEGRLKESIGEELAGNMHIARSRNDMGVAMYRLVLRDHLLLLLQHLQDLREALLEVAEEHRETVMPAYTHTQPAQPTTLAHYLLAVHDLVERDTRRLWSAYQTVNRSPLGAAALTTTGFDICRDSVKESLGFDDIVENSYDAIAGADYLLETATSVLMLMTDVGRWVQDMLQFCTREFRAVEVADPYVQISSIMPQKRNPVSVEHSRSLASSAAADAQAAITMVHNTPFGDIVDTEDDLQPHLYRAIDKSIRVLKLMTAVICTIDIDKEHLAKRARLGYITITELADVLVREKNLSFRIAHQIAAQVAQRAHRAGLELDHVPPQMLAEAALEVTNQAITFSEEKLAQIADPRHFIDVRRCPGSPHPTEVKRMLDNRILRLQEDREHWIRAKDRIRNARNRLKTRMNRLISVSKG